MDFWQVHGGFGGIIFLACIACFPRITMLLAVASPLGCLGWIGWVFAPHLTVAIMATYMYWHTNPILCVIAWFFALAGTGGEGTVAASAGAAGATGASGKAASN